MGGLCDFSAILCFLRYLSQKMKKINDLQYLFNRKTLLNFVLLTDLLLKSLIVEFLTMVYNMLEITLIFFLGDVLKLLEYMYPITSAMVIGSEQNFFDTLKTQYQKSIYVYVLLM